LTYSEKKFTETKFNDSYLNIIENPKLELKFLLGDFDLIELDLMNIEYFSPEKLTLIDAVSFSKQAKLSFPTQKTMKSFEKN